MKKLCILCLSLLLLLSCGGEKKGLNITIEPMVAIMPNEVASEIELVVNSDDDWILEHYESQSIPSWFEVSPLSGKAGSSKVILRVLEVNSTTLERVNFISFKTNDMTKTVTVSQLPPPIEEEVPPVDEGV